MSLSDYTRAICESTKWNVFPLKEVNVVRVFKPKNVEMR